MKASAVALLGFCLGLAPMASAQSEAEYYDQGMTVDTYATQNLLRVTNTRDSQISGLYLSTNNAGQPTGLIYERNSGAEQVNISASQLAQGAVLESGQGVDAVIIRGNLSTAGARINVRYIYNGLTGVYRDCNVQLTKSGGDWSIINARGQRTESAHLVIGTFGIQAIQGLCS